MRHCQVGHAAKRVVHHREAWHLTSTVRRIFCHFAAASTQGSVLAARLLSHFQPDDGATFQSAVEGPLPAVGEALVREWKSREELAIVVVGGLDTIHEAHSAAGGCEWLLEVRG